MAPPASRAAAGPMEAAGRRAGFETDGAMGAALALGAGKHGREATWTKGESDAQDTATFEWSRESIQAIRPVIAGKQPPYDIATINQVIYIALRQLDQLEEEFIPLKVIQAVAEKLCLPLTDVYDVALIHKPEAPEEEETSRPTSGRRRSSIATLPEPEPVPSRRASSRTRMPTLRHQAPKWWLPPEDVISAADAYDRRNHTRSLAAEGMLQHLSLDPSTQRGAQSFHDALQARICTCTCMDGWVVHAWRIHGACMTTLGMCSACTAPPRRAAGLTLALTAAGGAAEPLRAG